MQAPSISKKPLKGAGSGTMISKKYFDAIARVQLGCNARTAQHRHETVSVDLLSV